MLRQPHRRWNPKATKLRCQTRLSVQRPLIIIRATDFLAVPSWKLQRILGARRLASPRAQGSSTTQDASLNDLLKAADIFRDREEQLALPSTSVTPSQHEEAVLDGVAFELLRYYRYEVAPAV
jgi:hypothetical protein